MDTGLSQSTRSTFYGISAHLFVQLENLIQTLHKAHAPLAGYDTLLERQRVEQSLTGSPRQLPPEHVERLVAQELLVSQMSQQLTGYSEGLEQLHSLCLRQEQRVSCIENHAADLERQLGQKAKRISDLETDGTSKTGQIQGLQHQLQKYKRICSYVTMVTSQDQEPQDELKVASPSEAGEATASARRSDPDRVPLSPSASTVGAKSAVDMASGLRQLNPQHSSDESSMAVERVPSMKPQDTLAIQELRGTPWLKRMPCLIIGRHPQTPREVTVVCKQISGTLLLGDIKQELKVRCHQPDQALLSPAEFEALAGCSKGKNWKANIRVQGKNGCTQMLKIWLPGLLQLVGDHSKTAIAKNSDITALLDEESGLRIQDNVFQS